MSDAFRVFVGSLPEVCPSDARRMVLTADAGGRCEVFTWDAASRSVRQVTDRPEGTVHHAVDADAYVWWFDEDADGRGRWWFEPFDGGWRLPGLPGAPAGSPRGLAVTADGTVAAALAPRHGGTSLLVGRRGRTPREVLRTAGQARLGGITPEGDLLALATVSDGDASVVVVAASGRVLATLPGPDGLGDGSDDHEAPDAREDHEEPDARTGTGGRFWCRGFSPRPGRRELLLVHELRDGYELATWTAHRGLVTHSWCRFDTEITASWYPDTDEVLVRQERHGRSLLHRVSLPDRTRRVVPTPAGTLLDAAARPGGGLHYLWTDTAHPPVLRSTDEIALPAPGPLPHVPGHHTELWTPTPHGRVHTLLSLPEEAANGDGPGAGRIADGAAPPTVFLVHGGPADHDRDAYDATVHSLVASGYAVARVNYRGSTGYGPRWRRAFGTDVGHAQVDDLAAVRADLVRRGLADDRATALWGVSWGAYLVLLALGARPRTWQAGIAVKPVADWVSAHRLTTPALRALDVRWFGGTPEEVPDRYSRSSPLTFAAQVRAPLLLVGAERDVKCPPEQIRSYAAALTAAGVAHEELWLDTGHDGYDGAAHVAVLRRSLTFLHSRLPPPVADAPSRPPAPSGGPRSR
ncbi:alpha/beta hydrolase family protein [Streptomyces hilarionis]|uniref:alpha/beta hydrolase family protein n=1 Tax=Streptomyces hilarionis TaxID=2839954 RepID=UPI00211A274F|nr:alpha/beta fold hydrolase [Streptomyces hilarionis]MCQ9129610.1 alpha/beta fold hydrolase [Streptomyces hilarionis]